MYFFTLATYRRQRIFADTGRVELLRKRLREVKAKRPLDLLAAVVLPDHLHCLWCLPEGDADFSSRWPMLKCCLPILLARYGSFLMVCCRMPAFLRKNRQPSKTHKESQRKKPPAG